MWTALRQTLVAVLIVVTPAPAQVDEQALADQFRQLREAHRQDIERLRHDYEGRIRKLEGTVGTLRVELGRMEEVQGEGALEAEIDDVIQSLDGRVGLADFGQTTIFDNLFNPALSVVGDFVFSATDRDDSFESNNRFSLRALELGVAGRVDPLMSYYVYIHFDEDDVELEEAFGLVDNWLPNTLELKFGRYNIDFGKMSRVHDHDLPFVDKPQVLQEYLGGSLRGTGIELHHWFPVGESNLLRWSVGIVNELDGDGHAVFGPLAGEHHHSEEGGEAFGERELENFAFTGRLTALLEVGSESTLQLGASVAWAPEARRFFGEEDEAFAVDLERLLLGFDVRFRWLDPATGQGLTLGGELLYTHQDIFEDHHKKPDGLMDSSPETVGALGFYSYGIWDFDQHWSIGVSGGWFEHAEDDSHSSWDVGAFVTWRVDEFNRLRLEARYFDDPGEDYWAAMLQWTVILGSHGHGLDF